MLQFNTFCFPYDLIWGNLRKCNILRFLSSTREYVYHPLMSANLDCDLLTTWPTIDQLLTTWPTITFWPHGLLSPTDHMAYCRSTTDHMAYYHLLTTWPTITYWPHGLLSINYWFLIQVQITLCQDGFKIIVRLLTLYFFWGGVSTDTNIICITLLVYTKVAWHCLTYTCLVSMCSN